jgi:RNA polymerase sigma-70 factor, ECF subfamily
MQAISNEEAGSGDDLTLLQRIAARDSAALGELYERYWRLVFRVAYGVVGEVSPAEEVAQDTFLRLWDHAGRYQPGQGGLVPWMLTIARRRAIDELRSRRGTIGRRELPLCSMRSEDPADSAAAAQLRIDVRHALLTLPPAQREAVELLFWSGLSREEIARRTGAPLGTIHTRLRLGMEKLRGLLIPEPGGGPDLR